MLRLGYKKTRQDVEILSGLRANFYLIPNHRRDHPLAVRSLLVYWHWAILRDRFLCTY